MGNEKKGNIRRTITQERKEGRKTKEYDGKEGELGREGKK